MQNEEMLGNTVFCTLNDGCPQVHSSSGYLPETKPANNPSMDQGEDHEPTPLPELLVVVDC